MIELRKKSFEELEDYIWEVRGKVKFIKKILDFDFNAETIKKAIKETVEEILSFWEEEEEMSE